LEGTFGGRSDLQEWVRSIVRKYADRVESYIENLDMNTKNEIKVAIIAGEASGDFLGAKLMKEISNYINVKSYFGVGGENMKKAGFDSIFPMEDISIIGLSGIIFNLKSLIRKINFTKSHIVSNNPKILIIIDCPEFSHRVAAKVKKSLPGIIIINYVSPSIWAWRKNRATKMNRYIDHVLSILPFEKEMYNKLNGPKCTYVGHPLIEDFPQLDMAQRSVNVNNFPRDNIKIIMMPGSRISEVKKLLRPFGDSLIHLSKLYPKIEIVIPTLDNLKDYVKENTKNWILKPHIITDNKQKKQEMLNASAAIVCSGTATLEVSLARVPMVVAYKTQWLISFVRFFIPIKSIVLANIIHGELPIKELFQIKCTGKRIANEIMPLLEETHERVKQLRALDDIADKMYTKTNNPSRKAAKIIANYLM
jgi:lipid-A-disaccharide synthase